MSVPRTKKNLVKSFMRFALLFGILTAAPGVQAAQYDIKTMTPDIQRAIDGRQQRYDAILSMKSKGWIGENKEGYVSVLENPAAANALVQQENMDRGVIYGAIVEQNALGQGGMEKVKIAFAEVQRERARPGDSIQLPSGDWVKK